VLSDKRQALYARLYGRIARSLWVWGDHWWVGKLVELRGNRVKVGGCEFSLDSPAIRTAHKSRLFFDFVYETPEREALERYLKPELPVVELGASIGVIACLTNKKLTDPRRHVVVEANPDLLRLLIENRDRNACRFSVMHGALGYGARETRFYQHSDFLCGSLQHTSHKYVPVKTLGLGDVLDKFNYQRCTLICDIEGGEGDLIERELGLIAERVETLIIEIHEKVLGKEAVETFIHKLEDAGLTLVHKKWETYVFENSGTPRCVP
jgi:FkbM family methyltransferase